MQIELELLAPAKNKDIGIAAIDCGADAVYIAGPKFGARESAGNSISDIAELAAYAHRFRAKVYMTVNTILYDNELESAEQIIRQAYEASCDAIIVQDLALLKMTLPPIRLFASTQTNIRTVEQAVFLEKLGFERLILARELSLKQIAEIKAAVNVPLEAFVHGALCVSYSGQCYLSQKLTSRSANRGACAQACRSLYTLADNNGKIILNNAPVLSLKDLNLSNRIPVLVKAGITSFKIEGRLKNSSYIKNIVKLYREQIDTFLDSHPEYVRASLGNISGGFIPDPSLTFNRGYTQLFLDGQRGRWRSIDGAKYLGERIGTVTKSGKNKQGFLQFTYTAEPGENKRLPEPVINGDGLCFVTPGGEITGARANSCNENNITTTETTFIPAGSTLYRNYNQAFEKQLEKNKPQRLIPVTLTLEQGNQNTLLIRAVFPSQQTTPEKSYTATIRLERNTTPASNIPLARKNLFTQLSKTTGIFSFTLKSISDEIIIPFLPVSSINALRRELAGKIEAMIAASLQEEKPVQASIWTEKCPAKETTLTYLANCANTLSAAVYKEQGVKTIAPAYELSPVKEAELMRTRYCIKYELGLCPHYRQTAGEDPGYINKIKQWEISEPLFLINGKNKLKLKFDCTRCEMLIIG